VRDAITASMSAESAIAIFTRFSPSDYTNNNNGGGPKIIFIIIYIKIT
jgi:hypothetical protein